MTEAEAEVRERIIAAQLRTEGRSKIVGYLSRRMVEEFAQGDVKYATRLEILLSKVEEMTDQEFLTALSWEANV